VVDFEGTKIFYQGKEYDVGSSWFSINIAASDPLADAWALVNSASTYACFNEFSGTTLYINYDEINHTFYKTETTSNPTSKKPSEYDKLAKIVPALKTYVLAVCPSCGLVPKTTLTHMIIHLNDRHKWDRNAIADWLDTLDVDLTIPVEGNNNED
jgi:hypothetical protein